jgi:hypothetical protein
LNGQPKNKPDSLSEGILFLDGFIRNLEDIVGNKMGPLWHEKNRQFVKDGAARLKLFQEDWRRLKNNPDNHQIRLIHKKVSRVQQLISQYIMILEGSRSLVQEEISKINKAVMIRGYRFRNYVPVSGGQLC